VADARPGAFGPDAVLALQRQAGNQATAVTLQQADDNGASPDAASPAADAAPAPDAAPALEAGDDTDPVEQPTSADPADQKPFKAPGGSPPVGEEQQPEGTG